MDEFLRCLPTHLEIMLFCCHGLLICNAQVGDQDRKGPRGDQAVLCVPLVNFVILVVTDEEPIRKQEPPAKALGLVHSVQDAGFPLPQHLGLY